MCTYHLHAIALIAHIVGITFITGSCIGSMFIESHVWRQLKDAPYRTIVLLTILRRFPLMMTSGSLLLLASGLVLIGTSEWKLVNENYFIIKMVLYVLINLNGMLVAAPATLRLLKLLPGLVETDPHFNSDLSHIKNRMRLFHFSTFIMLIAIYALSIYK